MDFSVAIVGRPNVGKSTLFNRLVGRRLALVDDTPGVTRDRREGRANLGDLSFTVIDTAGFEESAPATLSGRMRAQTQAAIESADAVLFVFDVRAGLTPTDRAFADIVRKAGKPVIVVANKSEARTATVGANEAYALGMGEPVNISAEHGDGLGDLRDALVEALPEHTAHDEDEAEPADHTAPRPIRVAVIGRPNVGKSTLINRLIGEDRLLTGPEAGITRDSISVPLTWRGQPFLLHDTAGMRRRARIDDKIEKLSVGDALESIRFADVVIVLMDTQSAFEEQDMRLADLTEREGRALVVGINKWDLSTGGSAAAGKLRGEADHWLPQVKGVPIVALSGLTGEGLDRLMTAVLAAYGVWNKRVATNALNRWFGDATATNPPPAVSGRRLKLNYITQTKARPPTFVIFCTRADAVPDSYQRFLVNDLRQAFDMPGTPIRLILREKKNPYAGRKSR
jgi:GTP-binding protein